MFRLSCRAEIDDHEISIVDRYRISGQPIAFIPSDVRGLEVNEHVVSLEGLVGGLQYKLRFVGDILSIESHIRGGCEEFKKLLGTLESYGGEAVVEF
jgi:hypothetical protein